MKGRHFIIIAITGVVLLFPVLVSAQVGVEIGPDGGQIITPNFQFGWGTGAGMGMGIGGHGPIAQIASTIIFLINFVFVPVIFAFAFIVFLWGVFKAYILSHGEPGEVSKGHQLILWGLIAFVVMISLWGLVNVLSHTFGLAGYRAPILPISPIPALR